MEESSISNNGGEISVGDKWVWSGTHTHWWWAIATLAQLGLGIRACRKGFVGDDRFMPLKAFAVSSLFVGAGATSFFGTLRANGIYNVDDMKEVGANIRSGLGIPPRNRG